MLAYNQNFCQKNREAEISVVIVRKCHTLIKITGTLEQKSNKLCLRQWFHIFTAERWPTTKLSFRFTFLICEGFLWGIKLSCLDSSASPSQRHWGRNLTQSTPAPCCRGTSKGHRLVRVQSVKQHKMTSACSVKWHGRQWRWPFACLSPILDFTFLIQLMAYTPPSAARREQPPTEPLWIGLLTRKYLMIHL